ncbi:MAG: ADP-ribosylglycohydrolase family protein, partial [Bacillota bacterium]|nr:ADP-ribosylglycohydrolase family protein [Bacillota bacterium]
MPNKTLTAIMGLCVGDALGVPVEFNSREKLKQDPVVDMRSYGTYNQPAGTWSDDTSMTLCTLDSLSKG